MPACAVLTRLPAAAEALDDCADALAEVHSGLTAGEPDWVSTDVMIDEADGAVLLLTRWRRRGACESFEASPGYGALLRRLKPHLTGAPSSHPLKTVRSRKRGEADETDIAVSGGLG